MTALPDGWLHPHPCGWTLADVENLPEGSRVEVLDGTLIVKPRPLSIHQRIARRLAAALESGMLLGWQLETDVDVMLAEDPLDYVAPDIVVFTDRVSLSTRPIPSDAVLLVVEVVSRGSRRQDRGSKPLAYAEAGIPHFWRVEMPESGALAVTVHTASLEAGRYWETGAHAGRLTVAQPVPVDLDLGTLTE